MEHDLRMTIGRRKGRVIGQRMRILIAHQNGSGLRGEATGAVDIITQWNKRAILDHGDDAGIENILHIDLQGLSLPGCAEEVQS
jgi:hypothetical protein